MAAAHIELAFLACCGMICGFMDSEKQLPGQDAPSREADVYDLLAWLEVNKSKVAVVVGIAIVVGFAVAVYRYTAEQKELKASSALLSLKPSLIPSTNAAPADPSAYFKVAEEYSGTRAAQRAQYLGATALFDQNKYSEAENQFTKFLKDHGDSPWAADAAFGVAAAQEAQGKADAIASYQNVTTKWPQSAVASQAELALARIYEAKGQPEQALAIYNRLTASSPGSASQMMNPEVMEKKADLLRRHQNLSTNAVVTPAMQNNPVQGATVTLSNGNNSATIVPARTNSVEGTTNAPAAH